MSLSWLIFQYLSSFSKDRGVVFNISVTLCWYGWEFLRYGWFFLWKATFSRSRVLFIIQQLFDFSHSLKCDHNFYFRGNKIKTTITPHSLSRSTKPLKKSIPTPLINQKSRKNLFTKIKTKHLPLPLPLFIKILSNPL